LPVPTRFGGRVCGCRGAAGGGDVVHDSYLIVECRWRTEGLGEAAYRGPRRELASVGKGPPRRRRPRAAVVRVRLETEVRRLRACWSGP
jgi:hypothetical protein